MNLKIHFKGIPNLLENWHRCIREMGTLKLLLTMKLVLILIAVFSFTASSKTFSQQVTLSVKQASLETVMHEIRKQSGYAFIFNTADLRAAKRVTAELKDASIEQTMEFVFANQPFTYEIEEGTIVVKLNKRKNVSTVVQVLPQTITANGRVVDTLLNPLEGASIRVKGSRLSTSTDHNGAFSLKDVPVGGIIEFSHMGFITREIKAHGNMGIIVLSEVVSELDEVQVIAYGTTSEPF